VYFRKRGAQTRSILVIFVVGGEEIREKKLKIRVGNWGIVGHVPKTTKRRNEGSGDPQQLVRGGDNHKSGVRERGKGVTGGEPQVS